MYVHDSPPVSGMYSLMMMTVVMLPKFENDHVVERIAAFDVVSIDVSCLIDRTVR